MQKLLWLDLETTGLDPANSVPIEVYACVTNTDDYRIEREYESLIVGAHALQTNPKPYTGHSNTGLQTSWEEANRAFCKYTGLLLDFPQSLLAVQEALIALIADEEKPILAGSNPGFDRAFLRTYMPDLVSRLHYRQFDVNTLYILTGEKKANRKHRAKDDIEDDLKLVQAFRRSVLDRWR